MSDNQTLVMEETERFVNEDLLQLNSPTTQKESTIDGLKKTKISRRVKPEPSKDTELSLEAIK